jgi:acyl-CoA thioester hydrolase
MPLVHERIFRVRRYECDGYGHLNHANYLRYRQETAFDASPAAGYDMARYEALGHRWLIRATEIEHLRQLECDDQVHIRAWVDGFRRVGSRRIREFRAVGAHGLAARASTDRVYVNTATGQPVAIPPEMVTAF